MRNDAMNVAAVALETNPEEKDISKHIKVLQIFSNSFILTLLCIFHRPILIRSMDLHGTALLAATLEHLSPTNQSILSFFI
jgi:hypothetical protein